MGIKLNITAVPNVTTNAEELKLHERIHTANKPYSCSQGSYKCSTSSSFKSHEITRTGDKPLSCQKCNYKSSVSSALRVYERTHIADKPFSCLYFDYTSLTSSHLEGHERILIMENTSLKASHTIKVYLKTPNSLFLNFRNNGLNHLNKDFSLSKVVDLKGFILVSDSIFF